MHIASQAPSLDASRVEAIRRLNDDLRVRGLGGRFVITAGFAALPPTTQALAFRAVRTFDAFTTDNDPDGEHDFGSITVAAENLFWKIERYDLSLSVYAPEAAGATVTESVLTVMLAAEY